jgi:hypothetical protein
VGEGGREGGEGVVSGDAGNGRGWRREGEGREEKRQREGKACAAYIGKCARDCREEGGFDV